MPFFVTAPNTYYILGSGENVSQAIKHAGNNRLINVKTIHDENIIFMIVLALCGYWFLPNT